MPSRAIEYLKPSVDNMPADAATLAVVGNAYIADHKPNLALQQFQKAAALDPKNDRLKGDLIRVEAEIGGMRADLAKAHAFAKEDPVSPTYDIVSTELYETAGRRGEALELLEKTVAARPSADALIEVLSSFCARAGDSGKAEAVLNIRLQTDPNDFLYREKRDDCQRGRGWELSVHRGTSWCKESMLETY